MQETVNTFDLTFKGEVLSGHDPALVKTGLADLLCIEDEALVDELFAGGTHVLRSNLERKSAAEYFMKIRELGGQAELVRSASRNGSTEGDEETEAPPAPNARPGMNQEIHIQRPGQIDRSWPVSAARGTRRTAADSTSECSAQDDPETGPPSSSAPPGDNDNDSGDSSAPQQQTEAAPEATPQQAPPLEAATLKEAAQAMAAQERADREQAKLDRAAAERAAVEKAVQDAAARKEAAELDEISRVLKQARAQRAKNRSMIQLARESADRRVTALQQQAREINRLALESESRLQQRELEVCTNSDQQIAVMEENRRNTLEEAEAELGDLDESGLSISQSLVDQLDLLHRDQQEHEHALQHAIDKLEQERQELQQYSADELERLSQASLDTRVKRDAEITRLKALIEEAGHQADRDIAELEDMRTDVELRLETGLTDYAEKLEQQQQELTEKTRLAEEREHETREKCSALQRELEARRQAVSDKAEQSIAGVQARIDELGTQRQGELDRLRQILDQSREAARTELQELEEKQSEIRDNTDTLIRELKARLAAVPMPAVANLAPATGQLKPD